MPTVVALSCPVCGGQLKPPADTCPFCGSYVLIRSDLPRLNRLHLKDKVVQEQIAMLRHRVRADALDEEAHFGLGVAYFNLGLLDAAEDELSAAARLMPENPEVHAQLAVVLRDQVRSGDTGARDRFLKRIATTLRLDPNNVDALTLRAEDHARQGENDEMESLLARIERVDAARADYAREATWIARAERAIERDEWMQARSWIQRLAGRNASEAKRLVASYLARSRRPLPLRLVEPGFRRRAVRNAQLIAYAAVMAAVVLSLVVMMVTDHVIPILGALALFVVLPRVAVRRYGAVVAARERDTAIEIGPGDVDPTDDAALDTLLVKADALCRFRRGELLDLDRVGTLSISGFPPRLRPKGRAQKNRL